MKKHIAFNRSTVVGCLPVVFLFIFYSILDCRSEDAVKDDINKNTELNERTLTRDEWDLVREYRKVPTWYRPILFQKIKSASKGEIDPDKDSRRSEMNVTEESNEAMVKKIMHYIFYSEIAYKKAVSPGKYALDLSGLLDLDKRPMIPPDVMAGKARGYKFGRIEKSEKGMPYASDSGFAFYAVPEEHGHAGSKTFIVSSKGIVYQKDTGGKPIDEWPLDPNTSGWEIAK